MKPLALAISLSFLFMSSPAGAAEKMRAAFDVTVIEATKDPGEVDRKLDHLRDLLDRSFKGYKSFRQVTRTTFTVIEGESHSSTLVADQKLTVGLVSAGKTGFLKVRLETGDLKTVVDVKDGGLFFQAARAPSGVALVLAIRATSVRSTPTP